MKDAAKVTLTPRIKMTMSILDKLIKQNAEKGIHRLPAIHALARANHLSTHTVCKALAILRHQGVVTSSPRSGTRISLEGVDSAFELRSYRNAESVAVTHGRSHPLKQRILEDHLVGKLGREDNLPTMKELCTRYGSCFSSLKKVLGELENDGIVARHKKGYRLALAASGQSRVRLVVIAQTNSVQDLAKYTPRSSEFWRLIERECAARGLTIEFWTFEQARHNLSASRLHNNADVLGFIVLTLYESLEERSRTIAALGRIHRPVVVLDEIGKSVIPSPVMTDPLMRLFVMSTTTSPGKTIGNHLLHLGHRTTAYLGAFVNDNWSLNRYQGLKESFADAGIVEGVALSGADKFEEWKDYVMAESGTKPFETVRPDFEHIRQSMNPESGLDIRTLYLASMPFMWGMRLEAIMVPLFEKTLADRSITAWVAENDSIALLALDYLKSKGVQVPEEISVAGFDNVIESLGTGLTTFDFDVPALVQATMNHILLSGSARRMVNKGPLEIRGMLIKRTSTGPARKAPRV